MKGMYVFLKSRFLPLRRQETPTRSSVILQGEKAKYNFETFFWDTFIYAYNVHGTVILRGVDQNLVTMSLIYEIFAEGKSQKMNISKYCGSKGHD